MKTYSIRIINLITSNTLVLKRTSIKNNKINKKISLKNVKSEQKLELENSRDNIASIQCKIEISLKSSFSLTELAIMLGNTFF